MNFKLKTSLIIGAIVASSLVYAATVLSPNQNNNSGSIPSGYSDLEFSLANGNWVKNLSLPASANNADKITIRSSAAYSSYLDTSNTNIPLEVLKINSGDVYQFIFNSSQNKWIAQLATVSPTNGTNYEVVPLTTASMQKYSFKMTNGHKPLHYQVTYVTERPYKLFLQQVQAQRLIKQIYFSRAVLH